MVWLLRLGDRSSRSSLWTCRRPGFRTGHRQVWGIPASAKSKSSRSGSAPNRGPPRFRPTALSPGRARCASDCLGWRAHR